MPPKPSASASASAKASAMIKKSKITTALDKLTRPRSSGASARSGSSGSSARPGSSGSVAPPPEERRYITKIDPLDELKPNPISDKDTHTFLKKKNYPYIGDDVSQTTDDIKKYGDPLTIKAISSKDKGFKAEDAHILSLINSTISKLVADIKKTYLGKDNTEVNTTVNSIVSALNNITGEITPIILNISKTTDYFKINKDTNGNYNYLQDAPNDKFSKEARDTKDIYRTLQVSPRVTTIDTIGTGDLDNGEYSNVDADGKVLDVTTGELQVRLNNCYRLELLYMRKHEEILKLFAFILNLFDKYKYAIKLILYLLKSLVYRPLSSDSETTPITVKLPRPLITQIGMMVQDQDSIQKVVNQIEQDTKDLGKPLAIPTGTPGPPRASTSVPPRASTSGAPGAPVAPGVPDPSLSGTPP